MERTEKRVLTLDRYEHGVVINALNEMRNDLLEEERPTDIVDEVLLKVIDAYKASLEDISEAIRENQGDKLHSFFEEAKDYRDSMPMKMKGSIEPAYEIYVDLIDESGAVATIATILASNRISIKNIGILHNREFQGGVLRIEFYEKDAVEKATALLSKYSYIIHTR